MTGLPAIVVLLFLTATASVQQERPQAPTTSQRDGAAVCGDATRVARLARIDEAPDASMITIQSAVWCTVKELRQPLTWENKRTARHPSGAWHYPNGRVARTSGGVWEYPNGRTARTSSGTWYYPDGRTAKFESGRWQLPDGKTVTESELLMWACQNRGQTGCRQPLAEIRRLSGLDRDLAMIELVWSPR